MNSNNKHSVIHCKQLTKIYKGPLTRSANAVCALKNISLSVHKGQIVGLIGPNGSGKSTFLNLMAGIIFPTKGSLSVCGNPARSIQARRNLGYMPEHPAFLGRYSARAVLRYHGALSGLSRKEISAQTDNLIEQLQMKEYINRSCSEFSQGMKQRLALAVALINNPQVLLLDEPSNGLDPVGIILLRDLLKQLRDKGTSIVISSHRLGELEKLTSDYMFLYRGQVVSFGDKIASDQAGHLRIELISNGNSIAEKLLSPSRIISVSDTKLELSVSNSEEVSDIVSNLVKGGARIIGVFLQRENIEDVFLRLYNERN